MTRIGSRPLISAVDSGRARLASQKMPIHFDDSWRSIFLRGAMFGEPTIMAIFAVRLEEMGPPDPNLSRLLLRRAATTGSLEAEAIVAAAHINGAYGIERDFERG